MNGITLIKNERLNHFHNFFDLEHDATQNANGELALAAMCYACPPFAEKEKPGGPLSFFRGAKSGVMWPWSDEKWNPEPDNRIRELAKAGALIAAEIDRLLGLYQTQNKLPR